MSCAQAWRVWDGATKNYRASDGGWGGVPTETKTAQVLVKS